MSEYFNVSISLFKPQNQNDNHPQHQKSTPNSNSRASDELEHQASTLLIPNVSTDRKERMYNRRKFIRIL